MEQQKYYWWAEWSVWWSEWAAEPYASGPMSYAEAVAGLKKCEDRIAADKSFRMWRKGVEKVPADYKPDRPIPPCGTW